MKTQTQKLLAILFFVSFILMFVGFVDGWSIILGTIAATSFFWIVTMLFITEEDTD